MVAFFPIGRDRLKLKFGRSLATAASLLLAVLVAGILTNCTTYNPLTDPNLKYQASADAPAGPGVRIRYLGNTTFHITDGETSLLVDGFLSRPGALRTFVGPIRPNKYILEKEIARNQIGKLDAIIVGHAHHDHALDAPYFGKRFPEATVIGSTSYKAIHKGAGLSTDYPKFHDPASHGPKRDFGQFTVTMIPADHVASTNPVQEWIEGRIDKPLKMPAHFTRFNCGQVYAIHIYHREGSIAITTSAGPVTCPSKGEHADVLFLGVGFLSKQCCCAQQEYWRNTQQAFTPHTVIPVHWDNFAKKLPNKRGPYLSPPALTLLDNTEKAMAFVSKEAKKDGKALRVIDARDTLLLRGGVLR